MRVAKTFLLLFTMALIAADEPKKKEDAETFKGTWALASMKIGGRSAPQDLIKDFRCRFEDKSYTNSVAREQIEEGSYSIDASKTPKTIDFEIKKGHDEGKKQLGIYQIEGDKLTFVLAEPGATTRPKSFKIESGDTLVEVVLERAKP